MPVITVLVPCYNEEAVLHLFYKRTKEIIHTDSRCRQYHFSFLFVNDGSQDRTLEIMKELRERDRDVSYLSLSRNYGKEIAMLAGLDYTLAADAVIIMDADLQDPPELIPDMLDKWEQGYVDVYARRRNRRGESWFKKISAHVFHRFFSRLTGSTDTTDVGDFRLLDKQGVEAICSMREKQRYTKGLFNWIGFKKAAITYDRPPRVRGETKWNYWKLFQLAIEGITSFSTVPLQLSSWLGIIVSLCSFFYMLFVIVKTLLFGDPVAGYPSLVAIILFISGVQLIVLGIIGEYLGRVFKESKGRPVYFAEEFNGGKVYLHGKQK